MSTSSKRKYTASTAPILTSEVLRLAVVVCVAIVCAGFALSCAKTSTIASFEPTRPTGVHTPRDTPKEAPSKVLSAPTDPGPSVFDDVVPSAGGWYSASPLLISLREQERTNTASRAGLSSLEALPLYDLTLQIDPDGGTYSLEQQTYFTNTLSEPLDRIVFRVYGAPKSSKKMQPKSSPTDGKYPSAQTTKVILTRGGCELRPCRVTQGAASWIDVALETPLLPGEKLRINMQFDGRLSRVNPAELGLIAQSIQSMMQMSGDGVGDGTYGTMSVCDGFVSMANFHAVVGRRTNSGWEPPESSTIGDFGSDDLAHVRARIETPPLTRVVAAGTTARSVLVNSGGKLVRRHEVGAAMVRGFALFAGEKLMSTEKGMGDVVVRSWFLPSHDQAANRAADITAQALAVFEKRFGPYPYVELDVVQAPLTGGAGGIEFSGLIGVASMLYGGETGGLLDGLLGMLGSFSAGGKQKKTETEGKLGGSASGDLSSLLRGMEGGSAGTSSGTDDKRDLSSGGNLMGGMMDETFEFTIAHEVAHQWWYGLIGSDSRSNPFVDESLTQYSTLLYYEERYGQKRMQQVQDRLMRMNYLGMRLMGKADAAVDQPASAFDPMQYAGLVYGKGPYFYGEARKKMGDEVFFAALRSYADTYRFRTASEQGPIPFLAKGTWEKPIQALAHHWLKETHGDKDLGPIGMKSLFSGVLGIDLDSLMSMFEPADRLSGAKKKPDKKSDKNSDNKTSKSNPNSSQLDSGQLLELLQQMVESR